MKTSSIIKTIVASMSVMTAAAASAAPVAQYTMTDGVVSQKLVISGCTALKSGGLATTTFYKDDITGKQTFTMKRSGPGTYDTLPDLTGTWSVVPAKTAYTIYMSPYNSSVGPDPNAPTLPAPGIDVLLGALEVFAKANCSVKYPAPGAGDSVTINQPSMLVTKSIMSVKNADGAATLSLNLKGKQQNTFKGASKSGTASTMITIKGNVERATSCAPLPAACDLATVTM